jgi:hypothetical protein
LAGGTAAFIGGGIGAATFSVLLTPAVGIPVGFTVYYLTINNIGDHYTCVKLIDTLKPF